MSQKMVTKWLQTTIATAVSSSGGKNFGVLKNNFVRKKLDKFQKFEILKKY